MVHAKILAIFDNRTMAVAIPLAVSISLEILTGNLFSSSAQTLVNTVNCQGIMSAGIALEFRLRYPSMYEKYKPYCELGQLRPGILLRLKITPRWTPPALLRSAGC